MSDAIRFYGHIIHFYEIDGGPSGIYWEGKVGEDGPYIGTWTTREGILEIARVLSLADHRIRFHTQAEYELDSQLEEMLGG